MQESVEPSQGSRSSHYGGLGQPAPGGAKPRELIAVRRADIPYDLGRGGKVRAISQQSVARRTGLRRQHVAKAINQRAVVFGHVRASNSAAIMRAWNPSPAARIAASP